MLYSLIQDDDDDDDDDDDIFHVNNYTVWWGASVHNSCYFCFPECAVKTIFVRMSTMSKSQEPFP